jgi:hypothetical protein
MVFYALPFLTGFLFVSAILPRFSLVGRFGYGVLIGWSLVAIIQYLAFLVYPSNQNATTVAVMLALCVGSCLIYQFKRRKRPSVQKMDTAYAIAYLASITWLEWTILLLIIFRIAALSVSALSLPLYPWDAWDFWARQVKHWFATDDLAYTLSAQYPPFIPLMQLWVCKAIGRYDDVLISLPFVFATIGALFAMYAQIRARGVTRLVGLVISLLAVSLPIFEIHTAMAGYADLHTAVAFLLAAMALSNAVALREDGPSPFEHAKWWEQASLAVVCAACIALYKRPGIFWALLFLPVFWLAAYPYVSRLKWWLSVALSVPLAIWAVVYVDRTRGYGMTNVSLVPHYEGNLMLMVDNLLLWGNYHLLWLILSVAAAIAWRRSLSNHVLRPIFILISATATILVLGMCTYLDYAFWSTVIARATMHIAPTSVFLLGLLFLHSAQSDKRAGTSLQSFS